MEEFQNNYVDILTELYCLVGDIEDLDERLNLTYNYLLQHPKKVSAIISDQEHMNQIVVLHSLLEKDSFLLVREKLNRISHVLISLKQYELSSYVDTVIKIHEKIFQCFILEKIIPILKNGFLKECENIGAFQNLLTNFSFFVCDTYTGKNLIDNSIYHFIYPDLDSFYKFLDSNSFLERDHLKKEAYNLLTSDTYPDLKKFFHNAYLLFKDDAYYSYTLQEVQNIFMPKIKEILKRKRTKVTSNKEFEYYGSFF